MSKFPSLEFIFLKSFLLTQAMGISLLIVTLMLQDLVKCFFSTLGQIRYDCYQQQVLVKQVVSRDISLEWFFFFFKNTHTHTH